MMLAYHHSWTLIFLSTLLSFLQNNCQSFSFSTLSRRTSNRQITKIAPLQHLVLSQSQSSKEENIQSDLMNDDDDDEWTLEEDWALIDRVSMFTVGETNEMKRTFWAQLLVSTPELSSKSNEIELCKRYDKLCRQYLEKEDKVLATAGKSPPVLEDWYIEGQKSDGRMVGVLDGRTVWFSSNMMGRIDGNSYIDNPYLPGGFVEASGGRIYELGRPNSNMNSITNNNLSLEGSSQSDAERTGFLGIKWLTGQNALTATASALFASAILSFAVGYGAGLSLTTTSTSTYSREAALVRSRTAIVPRTSSVRIVERSSFASSGSTLPERTISEKRAIKEAQVLNEQRRVRFLSDKLEKDEVDLKQLKQEEISQTLSQ